MDFAAVPGVSAVEHDSQFRDNLGVLSAKLDFRHCAAACRGIKALTYRDYFRRFVLPV